MKTKLTKERLKELKMREDKLRKIVLSSRSGTTILDLSEQHAEEIADVLSEM